MRTLCLILALTACTGSDKDPDVEPVDTNVEATPTPTPAVDTDDTDVEDTDVDDTDVDDTEDSDPPEVMDPDGDEDGDGVRNADDCAPEEPTIFPGAPDICDGVDNDCGGDGDPPGTAWWQPTASDGEDVTALLTGTAESPASYALPDGGELRLCAGDWHVRLTADGVTTRVLGLGGRDQVSLAVSGRAIDAVGGAALTVQGLSIRADEAVHVGEAASVRLAGTRVSDTARVGTIDGLADNLWLEGVVIEDVDEVFELAAGSRVVMRNVELNRVRGLVGSGAGRMDLGGLTATDVAAGFRLSTGVDFTLVDSSFEQGGDPDGFLVAVGGARVDLTNVRFESLTGPAARIDAEQSTWTDVTVRDCATAEAPGVVSFASGDASLTRVAFEDNRSSTHGGALALEAASLLLCTSCDFARNSAEGDGGGLYYAEAPRQVELGDCTFRDNVATGSGGAVYAPATVLSVINSNFERNRAAVGGGVYVGPANGGVAVVRLNANVFHENEATTGDGGAVYADWVGVNLNRGSFTANTAAGDGGAVRTVRELLVDTVNFADNVAGGIGGAVRTESPSVVDISDSSFLRNSASGGGAIAYVADLHLTDVQLGTGADDNSPDDVSSSAGAWSYPGVQTLQCTPGCP